MNNTQELIERIEKHLLYLKEPQVMVAPATVFLLVSCKSQLQQAQETMREFVEYVAVLPCETKGLEDLEGGCCITCRAKQTLNNKETVCQKKL